MSENITRLSELQAKTELNDAEFKELIALSPKGTFFSLPSIVVAGLHDTTQASLNMLEINERIKRAHAEGFFVEAVSLRAQVLELFLRQFIGSVDAKRTPLNAEDKLTLGMLITESEQKGLSEALVLRLREFNTGRIKVIHRYMLGASAYAGLGDIFKASDGVVPDLMKEMLEKIGTKH